MKNITVNSDDFSRLMIAMHEEMKSLHKNGIWDLVKLLNKKKAVCCKWNFKEMKEFLALKKLDTRLD